MMTISTYEHLPSGIDLDRQTFERITTRFPMRISPHYLALIRTGCNPIARQAIPDQRELADLETPADPLSEETQAPVPQIIHRYPRRVIFLVSRQCAVYCRFCMRKRRFTGEGQIEPDAIDKGMAYIRSNTEINEVILSGGDPFMLPDERLVDMIGSLHRIPHIRILRIHTRIPNVWPQRISPETVKALSRFRPLYINIHFNHPDEITPEAETACAMLADAGIPLGSQTVLLKGVNDNGATLLDLFEKLLEIRVRPYYLHQLDRVPGTAHFRVSMEAALDLMNTLRGTLSGLAMPHLMVDLPGGGGKVEILPETCVTRDKHQWTINNYQGKSHIYPIVA